MASKPTCILCMEEYGNKEIISLGDKACATISAISESSGDNLMPIVGQTVHKLCRKNYLLRRSVLKRKSENNTQKVGLRSDNNFNFQIDCLFCGETVEKDLKHLPTPKKSFFPVRTKSFQDAIKARAVERNDNWGKTVLARIEYSQDLVASDALYHQNCSINFRTVSAIEKYDETPVKRQKVGRKLSQDTEIAFSEVVRYIESSKNKQLTLDELVNVMKSEIDASSEPYSNKHMKRRLIEYFGERIFISETCGKSNLVTLRSEACKLIENCYKQSASDNDETKKSKIIQTAAKLIKNDIAEIERNPNTYPGSDEIEDTDKCLSYLPESLRMFLDVLVTGKDTDLKKATIGQALVQCTRPISLLAPLQFSLAVQLHLLFKSRLLIDTLHEMGFCASYHEIQKYEKCAAVTQTYNIPGITGSRCLQFMADNVDHNIRTIDGMNTFHGMGMMMSITPGMKLNRKVPRINVTSADIAAIGKIKIVFMDPIQNIPTKFTPLPESIVADKSYNIDMLWKLSWLFRPRTPQWNGVMQMVHTGSHPGVSATMFLPMIDMDPSNESCIYSTLSFVTDLASTYKVDPIITFDQPLWYKAQMIIDTQPPSSPMLQIVCRLGGLHIQMSFLGTIGRIMTDSGLKELLETVYAENVVPHMLSGKAISRAIRGHLLAERVLCSLIAMKVFLIDIPDTLNETEENATACENENPPFEELGLNDVVGYCSTVDVANIEDMVNYCNESGSIINTSALKNEKSTPSENPDESDKNCGGNSVDINQQLQAAMKDFDSLLAAEVDLDSVVNSSKVEQVKVTMHNVVTNMKGSRTAKLWFEYLELLDILKRFIKGERTGDWLLHLQSLLEMLPFFAATGHNAYAKSTYIYLNKMLDLPTTHPKVYKNFMEGMHVVRRSDRYWAGLSTDLIIEQMLMRSVKTVGGLTRGSGMDEAQRAQWILSRPACSEINYKMQELTGQKCESSEQHKESAESRKSRDNDDIQKMFAFLVDRNPFMAEESLRSIASGVVAGERVNVDRAHEVGMKIVRDMEGKKIEDFKFSKKAQIIAMSDSASVRVGGDDLQIDPQLLFQRLIVAAQGAVPVDDLQNFFAYELCTYPPALFESAQLLRQANKSVLAQDITKSILNDDSRCYPFETKFVFDGGWLIQKLSWPRGRTYSELCAMYVKYVTDYYPNSHVVFDGYKAGPSTKDNTHKRRTGGRVGAEVRVQEDLLMNSKKQNFLLNTANKQNFIDMLAVKLEDAGVDVTKAEADADFDIVMTAVNYSKSINTVVVGEDTDLLVLLCYYVEDHGFTVHLNSEGRKKKSTNINDVKERLGVDVCGNILFIHAILGCDAVSKPSGVGKGAALKLFNKSIKFQECAKQFDKLPHEISKEEIEEHGERAMILLYTDRQIDRINDLRVRIFIEKTTVNSLSIDPKTLPPTASATKYHSLRTYYQILQWKGLDEDPCDYGWVLSNGVLVPKLTDMAPAPANILKVIRCSCKTGCRSMSCGCKKLGLNCTTVCRNCDGACYNQPQMYNFEEIK